MRRACDPSPTHRASAGARAVGQEQAPHRGRPPARGTEATAEGGEGVGGLHRSFGRRGTGWHPDPAEPRRPVWRRAYDRICHTRLRSWARSLPRSRWSPAWRRPSLRSLATSRVAIRWRRSTRASSRWRGAVRRCAGRSRGSRAPSSRPGHGSRSASFGPATMRANVRGCPVESYTTSRTSTRRSRSCRRSMQRSARAASAGRRRGSSAASPRRRTRPAGSRRPAGSQRQLSRARCGPATWARSRRVAQTPPTTRDASARCSACARRGMSSRAGAP